MTDQQRSRLRALVIIGIGVTILGFLWTFVSMATAPADLVSAQAPAPAVALSANELETAQAFRPFDTAIPVLAYHDITDSGSMDSITPEQFAAQMSMLDQAGFSTVTLAQVRSFVRGAPVELPGNPILLTFDGGDLSTWVDADPILAQHGFNGVVFVATSELGTALDPDHLNIDTLRRMLESKRWEIGGNTHLGDRLVTTDTGDVPWLTNRLTVAGHTETTDEWAQRVRTDLTTNRQVLQSELGVDAIAMSYPSPQNNPSEGDTDLTALLPAIIGEQFELGLRTGETLTSIDDTSVVTDLPRIAAFGLHTDPIALVGAIDEALPRPPSGELRPTAWVAGGQGDCHSSGDTVVISDEGITTCRLETATADRWTDVRVATTISGISGNASASIRVRDTDTDRIEISVHLDRMTVEEIAGDTRRLLATMPLELSVTDGATPMLVEIRGTLLVATVDQLPGLRVPVPPATDPGTISLAATTEGAGVITFTRLSILTFAEPESGIS